MNMERPYARTIHLAVGVWCKSRTHRFLGLSTSGLEKKYDSDQPLDIASPPETEIIVFRVDGQSIYSSARLAV